MPKNVDDLDTEDVTPKEGEDPSEEDDELVSAQEIRERYRRSPGWLEQKVKAGLIKRQKKGAKLVYREADVAEQVEYETKDQTVVNALGAATTLAEQATKNMQSMFELTQKANNDLMTTLLGSLNDMRAYVSQLEAQNREMRELSEQQKTEEHLRKLADIEQASAQAVRDKAMKMVQQIGLPLIAKKLGIALPTDSPAAGGAAGGIDPIMAAVAGDWLKSLTPEQLDKFREVLTPDQMQLLEMAQAMLKGVAPS